MFDKTRKKLQQYLGAYDYLLGDPSLQQQQQEAAFREGLWVQAQNQAATHWDNNNFLYNLGVGSVAASNTITCSTSAIDALAITEPNKPTKPKTAVDWLDEQIAVIRITGRQALSPAT